MDTPATKTMQRFLQREKHRVVDLSLEGEDGVFIYTRSNEWCDDAGSGTFHGSSETEAIKRFYERVQKASEADGLEIEPGIHLSGQFVRHLGRLAKETMDNSREGIDITEMSREERRKILFGK